MTRPFRHLALVGASTRAAAESVYLSGRTAVAADLFADLDLQRLCPATQVEDYPAGLLTWLSTVECDGWLYTGALENYPELVAAMAQVRPLLGCPSETLTRVCDPLLLQKTLVREGLRFPETHTAAANPDGDWLAKTYRGSSGSGVSSAREPEVGFLQRRISGIPGSAIFAGKTLLGVSRQLVGAAWTGAEEFQYCGSVAPWALPDAPMNQLVESGRVLYEQFDLQGLFGVDFIFDGTDVWPVEVNPRYTASVEALEVALGLQAIDWHLSACEVTGLPALPAPKPLPKPTIFGKAVWFAPQPLSFSQEHSAWALDQDYLTDIPQAGTEIERGEPVLTVRAEAWTIEEALEKLQSLIDTLAEQLLKE